jgi:hypothetical protein
LLPPIAGAATVSGTGFGNTSFKSRPKKITVPHYLPGTSKWNKIEHRLFAFISKNRQGILLTSRALAVSLIGATATVAGLTVT